MYSLGIDAGSRSIKIVLLDKYKEIVDYKIADQSMDQQQTVNMIVKEILDSKGKDNNRIRKIIATGYGRNTLYKIDKAITEITCHAEGVNSIVPGVRTIIDIGGQDAKVIKLDSNGKVRDFAMNERCASGTGRYLEMVAEMVKVDLEKISELIDENTIPVAINNTCAVFAQSDILSLIMNGASEKSIMAGVLKSIATRVVSLAGSKIESPIIFTGGLAKLEMMRKYLEVEFDKKIESTDNPQITGALGAALLGFD